MARPKKNPEAIENLTPIESAKAALASAAKAVTNKPSVTNIATLTTAVNVYAAHYWTAIDSDRPALETAPLGNGK